MKKLQLAYYTSIKDLGSLYNKLNAIAVHFSMSELLLIKVSNWIRLYPIEDI